MSDNKKSLQALYPFLHGHKQSPEQQQATLLESVKQKSAQSRAEKEHFFAKNGEALVATAETLANLYQQKQRLYCMGNGGSSCDAAHFSVEFHPVTTGRPALPAYNLCADSAMLTAVGNDVGMEQIFSRQLEAYATTGDGLVGFSTSGNSANLLQAYRKAKQLDMITIGFAGGDGGEMLNSGLLDHCLVVESDSIHRVQEIHLTCYHILWDLTHTLLADQRGNLGANR